MNASPGRDSKLKTCFIAAPAGAGIGLLRAVLESRGLRVLVPHEFSVGTEWASELHKQLSGADLVVGVITADRPSSGVFFELGQAWALGRRLIVIVAPSVEPLPFALSKAIVLHTDPNNKEAIEFALDQLMSAPTKPTHRPTPVDQAELSILGSGIDSLLSSLDVALTGRDPGSMEQIVAQALRQSGIDVVVEQAARGMGVDFAVWSDVLEPFVGNPLLVEVKYWLRGPTEAQRALQQVSTAAGRSGTRWALLLYGDGPEPEHPVWSAGPPNVLSLPIRRLLEGLRNRAFPEILRDLRNERVHGSAS